MNLNEQIKKVNNQNLAQLFLKRAKDLNVVLKKHGKFIKIISDGAIAAMNSMPPEILKERIDNLNCFVEQVEASDKKWGDISNCKLGLEIFAEKYGVKFPRGWYDNLGDEGLIVEGYCLETHIQVFRNTQFFDASSYALGDIFFRPFQELYFRSDNDNQAIMTEIGRISSSEKHIFHDFNTPVHNVIEIDTIEKNEWKFNHKWAFIAKDSEIEKAKFFFFAAKVKHLGSNKYKNLDAPKIEFKSGRKLGIVQQEL